MVSSFEHSEWLDGSELQEMDVKLARLGRGGARLRLRLGEALESFDAMNGHHVLGFSSMKAYVLERCERGARWAAESRVLARALMGGPGADAASDEVMACGAIRVFECRGGRRRSR